MSKWTDGWNCCQKNKRVKCVNCSNLEKCNKEMALIEKKRQLEEEEKRKACECFRCIWADKENMYCLFPRCMKDELR